MSLEADFMMRKLKQLPVTQALKKGTVELPAVKAPSLEGLVMTVELPGPPTADELCGRFVSLLREHGERRERAPGEKVELGDELWVDLIGYSGGKLMAGMKLDWPLDLVADPMLEGLAEQLEGVPVGGSAVATVVLGPEHPNVAARGAQAELLVQIHRAYEVKPLDGENLTALAKLGRGATLDAVMESISAQLAQLGADAAWVDAEEQVLAEVAERAGADVSGALIDEELRRRWGAAEGTKLSAKGFDAAEQQEALDLWLKDPELRADARARLRLSLALKAIAERDGIIPDPAQVEAIMVASAAPFGLDAAALKSAVKTEPSAARALVEAAFQQQLIGYVLEGAEVREVEVG